MMASWSTTNIGAHYNILILIAIVFRFSISLFDLTLHLTLPFGTCKKSSCFPCNGYYPLPCMLQSYMYICHNMLRSYTTILYILWFQCQFILKEAFYALHPFLHLQPCFDTMLSERISTNVPSTIVYFCVFEMQIWMTYKY